MTYLDHLICFQDGVDGLLYEEFSFSQEYLNLV